MISGNVRLGIVLLVAAVSGCAGPMIWDKADGTQAAYNKDSYEGEKDTRQSGYFDGGLAGDGRGCRYIKFEVVGGQRLCFYNCGMGSVKTISIPPGASCPITVDENG